MRATVDIDDQSLLSAKDLSVQQGCTFKQILEDALRDFFSHQSGQQEPVSLETFLRLGNCSCIALTPASMQSLKMNKNPAQFGYIHSWKSP